MLYTDLPHYESTGKWIAQRKFRGSRAVINISPTGEVTLGSRHGKPFSNFTLDIKLKEDILSLNLQSGLEYWLDGELMNKDKNPTNEIILFDVLQAGRYFFMSPNQFERLQILSDICRNPSDLCHSGIALKVSDRIWMAQTFVSNFVDRFKESLPIPQLEGLVLRKKLSNLSNFGNVEYSTSDMIRCRKSFSCDAPKIQRSGGYEF